MITSVLAPTMQEDFFEEMINSKKDSSPDQYYLCTPLLTRSKRKTTNLLKLFAALQIYG